MKRIIAMLLLLAVAPFMLLFSCGNDSGSDEADNSDNPDENKTNELNEDITDIIPTEPVTDEPEPEPAFVFEYDFTGKTTNLPTPTANKLPSSWKGFNLLNMFYRGSEDRLWKEEEFKMMAEWGFNFARIPMDYRIWAKPTDWDFMDETQIKRIDKVVEYGIKYDIHICLNFHRAPGFTVASPAETTNLWTDKEPQEAFAKMWGFLAARYKNIPNEYLSFNLVNEPPDISEKIYAEVMKKAADAIWEQDPNRLIIADGLAWGTKPSYMIKDLGMAQASRGYTPTNLTHYLAEWMEGAENYSLPTWPTIVLPKHLYSVGKSDMQSVYAPYVIEHYFNEDYYLDVNIGIVSSEAKLVVKADGEIIYEHLFKSGKGEGDWTVEVYREEWNVYQNIFNKDYRIEIPAGTKLLTLDVVSGDWMTVNDMKFSSVSGTGKAFSLTPTTDDWGVKIPAVKIDANGEIVLDGSEVRDGKWLRESYLKPWEDFINSGGGAMIGEWGSHNKTPHDVVLRWMKDNLDNYKEIGMGWALWNFNASFGILNSGRADVDYEDYNGYKLDREMLELLLKYVD
ncbi:MAG: cellulase family glycosylhydrolase [Oscillospiraceae bacterium]|nr:cellulase family glycosylhydrolase [Oscillospiraceae bacterium]